VSALRKGGARHRERAAGALQIKSSFPEKLRYALYSDKRIEVSRVAVPTFVLRLKVGYGQKDRALVQFSTGLLLQSAHRTERRRGKKRKKSAKQFLEFQVKKPRVCLQQASASEREESLTRRGQKSFKTAELVSGSRLCTVLVSLVGSMKFCKPKKRGEES